MPDITAKLTLNRYFNQHKKYIIIKNNSNQDSTKQQ